VSNSEATTGNTEGASQETPSATHATARGEAAVPRRYEVARYKARTGGAGFSGQVSGCESRFFGELVESFLVAAAGGLQRSRFGVGEFGQAGA
jgi:hypothetical protein